ncbi:MAG: hypothetical protein ACLT38_09495 [Akkermansia sp.]
MGQIYCGNRAICPIPAPGRLCRHDSRWTTTGRLLDTLSLRPGQKHHRHFYQ